MSTPVMKTAFLFVAWTALLGLLLDIRSDAKVRHVQLQLARQLTQQRHDLEVMVKEVKGSCACNTTEPSTAVPVVTGLLPRAAAVIPMPSANDEDQAENAEAAAVAAEGTPPTAAPKKRGRRLVGFFRVGTSTASVICWSVNNTNTIADMSSDYCRGSSGWICQGCFIATDTNNDKTLQVIKCSSAKYKVNGTIGDLGAHAMEISIINADLDNSLTVEACSDTACSMKRATYVMNGGDSVNGFCYTGGDDNLYFPSAVFANSAAVDFTGKTIADAGSVTTIDINGGSIDNTNINVGNGTTLDLTGGNLILDDGAIPATKVSGGAFAPGFYSFGSSTITDGGTIYTIDIDGGVINNTDVDIHTRTLNVSKGTLLLADGQIPANKVSGGTFQAGTYSFAGSTISALDMSAGTLGLADGQIPANKVSGGTFHPGTYSFTGSTVADLGTVNNIDINGGTIDGVVMNTSNVTVPSGNELDVSAGTLTLRGSQVPADKVGPGLFGAGSYWFTGSTIAYTGVISYADIDGGTLDDVTIGVTKPSVARIKQLRLGMDPLIAEDAIPAWADPIPQAGVIWSSEVGLAAGTTRTITVPNTLVGTNVGVLATALACTGGEVVVLDTKTYGSLAHAAPDGYFTVRVKNIGASACTSPYGIIWWLLVPI